MNKPIHIHHNLIKPSWNRNLEQHRFPIQIVQDKFGAKWITLTKHIDFNNATYKNINLFFIFSKGMKIWIEQLLNGENSAQFAEGDIIRNPTLEEYNIINQRLKQYNITINKKRTHEEKNY